MATPKRTATTKDIALLHQLYEADQLILAPDFQRQSVWPRQARAYLIDTILADRPIPLLFFTRTVGAQTGRQGYTVVDGQQRLRAIFDFIDGKFALAENAETSPPWRGKKFATLRQRDREQLLNYDLTVIELSGYSDAEIRDVFVRMNRYVVRLAAQELRHAREKGAFKDFVSDLASWSYWEEAKVFTPSQKSRMRNVEFMAELTILIAESAPQDKKSSIDDYYQTFSDKFPEGSYIRTLLMYYLEAIELILPDISSGRWRKPVDFYALVGALDELNAAGFDLDDLDHEAAGARLQDLERRMKLRRPDKEASRYLVAASRQTDNLQPRTTRIEVLQNTLAG